MPVFNGEKYLREAIDSVLNQTFEDFELLIINDGSKDSSRAIIESYKDSRIRLTNQANQGLVPTLNRAIKSAKGEYIARHDCDDVSRPDRLSLQVDYLKNHPSVGLLGSGYNIVDEGGGFMERFVPFSDKISVRQDFLIRNPFGHGTVMFRKSLVGTVGLYANVSYTEDYEYWWRFSKASEVVSLPDALYDWRVLKSSMSHTSNQQSNWDLMNKLRRDIWKESDLPGLVKDRFFSRALYYRRQEEHVLYGQFINLQVALCVSLRVQGQDRLSRRLLAKLVLIHPKVVMRYPRALKEHQVGSYDLDFLFENDLIRNGELREVE
jgi:glycosyltransferase involved in cell wall biosynthesis